VHRILKAAKSDIKALIGNSTALKVLRPESFTDETFGLPMVMDILKELEKQGRDPRPAFRTAAFQEGVETLADVKPGMVLEGVVTNVAAFGAFVDVGVHQDGLVHISALANTFVKDPRSVVKPGDVVRVKVLEVDQARKRIALTMRLDDEARQHPTPTRGSRNAAGPRSAPGRSEVTRQSGNREKGGAMADALRRAMESVDKPKGRGRGS
jgi:uncharacterized protein